MPLNIEIKARCHQQDSIRKILENKNATFKGIDHQIDTYFEVAKGRLKLRQGSIEKNLIYYDRPDQSGPKISKVSLYPCPDDSDQLRETLSNALGVKVVVDKQREIYFLDNVKFHLDKVKDLGTFVEIEAIDTDNTISMEKLNEQCLYYLKLFGIENEDLINNSYSDLLVASS